MVQEAASKIHPRFIAPCLHEEASTHDSVMRCISPRL
jgi:hypothetical protein